ACGQLRIKQNPDARDTRRDLLKEFNPFGGQRRLKKIRESRNIAAGMRKILDESAANGIRNHCEYDWEGPGALMQNGCNRSALRQNHFRRRGQDICHRRSYDFGAARAEAKVDPQVLAEV